MIILHGFGPALGLPDVSPFVTKVELLLKFARLPYEAVVGNPLRAPKRKLPIIADGERVIADSTFIRWYLEETYGVDFDAGLSQAERATAWAFERLLEDHIYWALVHARWLDVANYEAGPKAFFARFPWPLRPLLERFVLRAVRKRLYQQGMGRHTPDEIARLAAASLDALASFLADKPYLMGARPCGVDATLFAFLVGAQSPAFSGKLTEAANRHPNLVAYVQRIRAEYYPAEAASSAG